MVGDEDSDDDIPATQPVMSVLLDGVVAYVEVRSGHDNRSRGVKTQLRNLGAKVEDTFTKNVTHVVFNEGMPSTYKKAKKLKCHLVSVLWIEACKEELTKVSEAGYPPIGQQIYENPHSLKNFKKLKSMQPDFDDNVDDLIINQMRKRIQRRRAKWEPVPATSDYEIMPPPKVPKSKGSEKKSAAKKQAKKSTKGTKKAVNSSALKEITPDVNNKTVCFDDKEITTRTESSGELQSSQNSSGSSVIFCGELESAGPSRKSSRKSTKSSDNTPVTRSEFVKGLTSIMLSLSTENDPKTSEISPWRKCVGPPPIPKPKRKTFVLKTPSPRRSPRNITSAVDCFVSPDALPRRSPREMKGIEKISNKDTNTNLLAPPCASASAALKHKKKFSSLPAPGNNFILLSQEPGDMPSLEEMAKEKKGAISTGGQCITLSQIIKSYNAAAQGPTDSPAASCKSSSSSLLHLGASVASSSGNGQIAPDATRPEDDIACDSVRCWSRGSSDAGSSTSTKVLINGKSPENCCPVEEHNREPSPIFVIKKGGNFRRTKKEHFRLKNETSNTEGSKQAYPSNGSADDPSTGKRKVTDYLSPIVRPAKEKREIFENDKMSAISVIVGGNISQKGFERKRNKSVPESGNKRQKLNHSDPQCSSENRKVQTCLADSKTRASCSDLSSFSSSGRKSSEDAKKRIARSLTKNYFSNESTNKVIVCSFLTASEQISIEAAVETLNGCKLEQKVTSRTTHVVNSGPNRTLNMLKGMARGCWLLDQRWVLDSSKAGIWLAEENYELVTFSSAVRTCRIKRKTMGKEYKHTLFARAGTIFVSPKTDGPPVKDIRELLVLCGAELKSSPQNAKIIIGRVPGNMGTKCVHPCWVLDSITKNKILPINDSKYQVK